MARLARDDWDALAGAVAAGHVIECGPQATGGNYSFLDEITDRRYPGFPIAEVAADGSSVITKHDGTGGLVSPGTVTAQLLYEIGDPAYLNPDVVAHFDTIRLEQAGPDRVALTGTRGSPPPDTLKVALNMLGGYRNTTTMVLTGLDIEAKAAHATSLLTELLGGTEPVRRVRRAAAALRPSGRGRATRRPPPTCGSRSRTPTSARSAGPLSSAIWSSPSAGTPGSTPPAPPTGASAFGVYWPALVPSRQVAQEVHLPDGSTQPVRHTGDLRRVPAPVDQADLPGPADAQPDDLGVLRRRAGRGPARAAVRRPLRRQGRRRQRGAVGASARAPTPGCAGT